MSHNKIVKLQISLSIAINQATCECMKKNSNRLYKAITKTTKIYLNIQAHYIYKDQIKFIKTLAERKREGDYRCKVKKRTVRRKETLEFGNFWNQGKSAKRRRRNLEKSWGLVQNYRQYINNSTWGCFGICVKLEVRF